MLRNLVSRVSASLKAPQVLSSETLVSFKRPDEVTNMLVRSDQELGGFSTANLDVDDGVAHFHGVLNLDPPPNRPDVMYSGYAMFRTKDQPRGLFNTEKFWDWDNYHNVILRVKGDHRKYFVNIQAQTAVATDVYQHRLFLNTPGSWETVTIPIDDFVLTNRGVIQHQSPLDRTKVKTIGIGLLDNQFGPFSLLVDSIAVAHGGAEDEAKRKKRQEEAEEEFDVFRGNSL